MGRKSTAKQQIARAQAAEAHSASKGGIVIALVGLLIAVVGLIVFTKSRAADSSSDKAAGHSVPAPAKTAQTAAGSAQEAPSEPPTGVKLMPHPQANLPPLPFNPAPPARPFDVVRAAYRFAAEHPEVLGYVPCYCGCERNGHRGNEDCFVTARAGNGDVTEWEPHGMT